MQNPLATWVLILICSSVAAAGHADTPQGHIIIETKTGSINWSRGVVEARGKAIPPDSFQGNQQGRSMAVQDAVSAAQMNIIKTIEAIRINADSQISDVLRGNDEIAKKLQDMIQEAKITNQKFLTDGTVEVTVQLSLYGGFSQLLLPADIKQIESIKAVPSKKAAAKKATGTDQDSVPKTTSFTGIVVDARGIGLIPSLSPRILDENGREVFGAAFASREFAVQNGMVGYTTDLQTASSDPRVADKPLLIKGLKTKGLNHCDIVVSISDANKLRGHFDHLCFLKRCAVVIVSDPSGPPPQG